MAEGGQWKVKEAAKRELSAILPFHPPFLGLAQAVPSTQHLDPISPFLKLCSNAISSRKPYPNAIWMGSFLLLNPKALFRSPFRPLVSFCPRSQGLLNMRYLPQ